MTLTATPLGPTSLLESLSIEVAGCSHVTCRHRIPARDLTCVTLAAAHSSALAGQGVPKCPGVGVGAGGDRCTSCQHLPLITLFATAYDHHHHTQNLQGYQRSTQWACIRPQRPCWIRQRHSASISFPAPSTCRFLASRLPAAGMQAAGAGGGPPHQGDHGRAVQRNRPHTLGSLQWHMVQ